jgi:hypothetical protein
LLALTVHIPDRAEAQPGSGSLTVILDLQPGADVPFGFRWFFSHDDPDTFTLFDGQGMVFDVPDNQALLVEHPGATAGFDRTPAGWVFRSIDCQGRLGQSTVVFGRDITNPAIDTMVGSEDVVCRFTFVNLEAAAAHLGAPIAPRGSTLVRWNGGTVQDLTDVLAVFGGASATVSRPNGSTLTVIASDLAFVNSAFGREFPGGVPDGTLLFVRSIRR